MARIQVIISDIYMLDAKQSEVADLVSKGRKTKRRGRKPKS